MNKVKKYEELQFYDDFLFCKILESRKDICREILELILGIKINNVEVQKQKEIEITADSRGIRLDVYAEEDSCVYDIEMQTTISSSLPKRSRYYQGIIDLNLIEKGASFSALRKSYVIFICMTDPLKANRYVYTFENICLEDTSVRLGDEAIKVFLNVSGSVGEISDNLRDFFNMIRTGQGDTALSKEIIREVEKSRSKHRWREDYMINQAKYWDIREEALEEGRQEGILTAVKSLMKHNNCSFVEAMEMLSIPASDQDKLREMVKC